MKCEDFVVGNYYSTYRGVLLCKEIHNGYCKFVKTDLETEVIINDLLLDGAKLACPIITETGIPEYQTVNSAGVDLKSSEDVVLYPFTPTLIHTGIKLAIPVGYEAQVRPRSGLALKESVTVLNAPGTIDADYRGEVGVILILLSSDFSSGYQIHKGDRIAQLVFSKVEQLDFFGVDRLESTERGEGGFGHTGK